LLILNGRSGFRCSNNNNNNNNNNDSNFQRRKALHIYYTKSDVYAMNNNTKWMNAIILLGIVSILLVGCNTDK
jgi:hypothetical protein